MTEKDKRVDSANRACTAYERAQEAANKLAPTNPIRLGLALNFSVFFYEIMGKQQKACELAKSAFDLVRFFNNDGSTPPHMTEMSCSRSPDRLSFSRSLAI